MIRLTFASNCSRLMFGVHSTAPPLVARDATAGTGPRSRSRTPAIARADAEERVAAEAALLRRLEQERRRARLPQLEKSGDGRLAVVHERRPDRYRVRAPGKLPRLLETRLEVEGAGVSGDGH